MTKTLLIIGHNFSGKTAVFNSLTGGTARRTAYPGTAMRLNVGRAKIGGESYEVLEAPGVYTLIPTSENETVTLNLLLRLQPAKIIFTANEETLETGILIMIQLAELGIPFVINYQAETVSRQEYFFDTDRLAQAFHAEVVVGVPIISPNTAALKKALGRSHKPRWVGGYSRNIEKIIQNFEQDFKFIPSAAAKVSLRFICLMLLFGNKNIINWLRRAFTPEVRGRMLSYAQNKYAVAYSFTIANRWESLSRSLFQEIWQQDSPLPDGGSRFFEEYSLRFFWDLLLAAAVLSALFAFVHLVGGGLLVRFFYDELLSKYLAPFLAYIVTSLCGDNLVSAFLVGQYGILTNGLAYAYALLLPMLGSFFFGYAFLENTGYSKRLSLTFNKFLRLWGLNGQALPGLLFSCCKVAALNKSVALRTGKERTVNLLLLLFFIPCVSQLAIIVNLLAIIQFRHALIFAGVMALQMLLILVLNNLLVRQPANSYIAKVTPLRRPDFTKIAVTTWIYTRWYIVRLTPLLLGVSALLFAAQVTGLLEYLRGAVAPLIRTFLDLPESFTDSVVLGLFRKDLGAVSLYDLANNGMLNSIQVLVSLLFISLSAPCLGFVGEIRRQKGWGWAVFIFTAATVYAFVVAALVNKILHI
ncbi:ferrous iron transport protein B [Candidatus Termititenax persephonae]|uniref:Ferrous iron transport protein B n=1 Tax=Candidatus Termititenax persephonae TaxID=2218525 RepID=A0A388TI31_9BACT|nr:ferrous iron transport protein B [Candidatus Termititenax persephonae]